MEVTQKTLAECLGISSRQIRNLKNQGLFKLEDGEKKYDLQKCVQEYINFKIDAETGRKAFIDKEKVAAEHEEIKKQIAMLKLRKLRRETHEASDVEAYLTSMLTAFKNRIETLPAKAAMQVVGMKDINEIIKVLKTCVNESLNELSEYDPDEIDGMAAGTYEEDLEDIEDEDSEEEDNEE